MKVLNDCNSGDVIRNEKGKKQKGDPDWVEKEGTRARCALLANSKDPRKNYTYNGTKLSNVK